eukprot:6179910-Pleurochrysis_carterae.AAC.9
MEILECLLVVSGCVAFQSRASRPYLLMELGCKPYEGRCSDPAAHSAFGSALALDYDIACLHARCLEALEETLLSRSRICTAAA